MSARRVLAVALVATLPLLGLACGDDEDGTAATTTTEAGQPCAEVYTAGDGAPEGADAVEERGAPEMSGCQASDELVIIDEVEGSGAEVQPGDTITAHYTGIVASNGVEFDSSWSRGAPATFPLDQVIPGWTEGLVGMKVGGRRTLIIPSDLGYGQGPPPGSGIQPGDDLVFTVDLTAIEEPVSDPIGSETTISGG